MRPKDTIEILSFEATTTAEVADKAAAMVGSAYRLRIMGSLALSLCHLAAGRVDAVCSLKPARSVDIAAGQLLVRECGLAIDLFEESPFEAAPLDLVGRSRVVAAGTAELSRKLADALTAGADRGTNARASRPARLGRTRAIAPPSTVAEPGPQPAPDLDAATILVCDDDPSLRELVRAVLGPSYRFVEAADGVEALDARAGDPARPDRARRDASRS